MSGARGNHEDLRKQPSEHADSHMREDALEGVSRRSAFVTRAGLLTRVLLPIWWTERS